MGFLPKIAISIVVALSSLPVASVAKASTYAAIAYSVSARTYATGRSEEGFKAAYRAAWENCGGGDCIVRAGVQDGCMAFAHDSAWEGIGVGKGESLEEAQRDALFLCETTWPSSCKLYHSFCTNDDER